MIRDIRSTDNPEVVVARGQLYDLEKVLDVGFDLLVSLIEAIRSQFGFEGFELKTTGGDWAKSFDARVRRALKKRCFEEKAQYDVSTFWIRIHVSQFHIRFYPLGTERLMVESGEILESFGNPAEELNPEPQIIISPRIPSGSIPIMSLGPTIRRLLTRQSPDLIPFPQKRICLEEDNREGEKGSFCFDDATLAFLKLQLRLHCSKGIEVGRIGSVATLRFLPEFFGLGEGDLRIDCMADD